MSTDGRTRLQTLLALTDQDRTSSMLELIATRTVTALTVSGAGITVLSHLGDGAPPQRGLVYATNPISHQLDTLQLTVGEGPCLDAFHTVAPVLIADLDTDGHRWPGFSPAAREYGAAAVFSFPLLVGAVRLGSLDAYRDTTGPLTEQEHSDALLLAQAATQALLEDISGHSADGAVWLADTHTESGIIAGAVFAAVTSFGEISVSLFVSTPETITIPVRTFGYIDQTFDPSVNAIAVIFIALSVIALVIIEKTIGLSKVM